MPGGLEDYAVRNQDRLMRDGRKVRGSLFRGKRRDLWREKGVKGIERKVRPASSGGPRPKGRDILKELLSQSWDAIDTCKEKKV